MATVNYTGPEELEGVLHLFDLEFDLVSGISGRATSVSDTTENAVSMTERSLLDLGHSINNADVYDVVYLDIDLKYLDVSDSYKAIIIGTTASG